MGTLSGQPTRLPSRLRSCAMAEARTDVPLDAPVVLVHGLGSSFEHGWRAAGWIENEIDHWLLDRIIKTRGPTAPGTVPL